jgi:AcrR family transcriptional regulator
MSPKDENRRKILQAAFEAFAESGYEKTSMDDIVRLSGLSKGSLYWHFKNKQELFNSTLQLVFQEFGQQLAALVELDAPASDRIRAFFEQASELMSTGKNTIGLLTDAFFQAHQNDEAQQIMLDMYKDYIASVGQVIQQGIDRGEFREVDPHMTAIILMAGGDGVAFYTLLDSEWDLKVALNMIVDLILTGLRKEPDSI